MMLLKSKKRRFLLLIVILLASYEISLIHVRAWEINKTDSVTGIQDGDTFYIDTESNGVRLADIDAPEEGESGYSQAKNALSNLIGGKTVYLDTDRQSGRDPYGRLVVVVYVKVNNTHYMNVNKALLKQGVVDLDDYSNNEFNPSTWTLFLQYYFPLDPTPTPPPPGPTPTPPPIPTPPLPPILSDLIITPKEIELGDEVTIGLDVMNIDSQSFTYIVTMQIGELTLLIDVELEPYESKTVNRTITPDMVGDFNVTVDGLTGSFTVKAPPKPAEFEFSNLRIFFPGVIPPEVERDQTVTVTVSIDVTNVGEEMGGCIVELKVNGEVFDSEEIPPFGGGVTATQLFELTRGEGTYEVEVDGLTDSFTVNPKLSFWDKIPGFPYESIIFGLVTGTFLLWMFSRRIMTL